MLPGLEVILSNYISVKEGSGCLPVPVPAFLGPALGNITISTNTSFSWWGQRGGKPWNGRYSRHWSKGREGIGNELGPKGISVSSEPSYSPHSLIGPWGDTSELSHLRGHSRGSLDPEILSLPWAPTHFQNFPLTQAAHCSSWGTNWMRTRQVPSPLHLSLSSQQPGQEAWSRASASQLSLPGSCC